MRMDHVNIRCTNLEITRDFLRDVIGLTEGDRPPFAFPGFWMVDEHGHPCAHLIGARRDLGPAGAVDHVAFYYEDLPEQMQRLARHGFAPTLSEVPGRNIRQGFIDGPDGMKYEIQGPLGPVG